MNGAGLSGHPGPEVLAAFVDGALEGDELRTVSSHLRTCDDCRLVVGEAAHFERQEAPEVAVGPSKARGWWWLAAAAAVVVLALLAIPLRERFFDPLAELQPREIRTTLARVSRFRYAPYRATRAGQSPENWRGMGAAARLQERVAHERSAENLHRYALAEIALGKSATAGDLLHEASTLEPENASILSDLAAAQLANALPGEAAENAAKALQRDPSLQPAAFNWALALEQLYNRPAAIEAWQKYLTLDQASGWAKEARDHLARLRAPRRSWKGDAALLRPGIDSSTLQMVVATYPQRVRFWVQDELLPRWVEQRRPEDFELIRRIAAMRAKGGDSFLVGILPDARPDARFVQGVRAFRNARMASWAGRMDEAAASFATSASLLRQAGSPLALAADVFAASTDFYRGKSEPALKRLDSIEEPLRPYPSLTAEALWVRALVLTRLGRNDEALQCYRTALEDSTQAGEVEHEASITSLIATTLSELVGTMTDRAALDDPAEPERLLFESLRRFDEIGANPGRFYGAYSEIGFALLRDRRPRVALAFIDAQERIARGIPDPLLIAESESARALALRDLGRARAALVALEAARHSAVSVPNEGLRDRVTSDAEFIAGTIPNVEKPEESLASISRAMTVWAKYGWRIRMATALLASGNVRLRSGDSRGAESDFRAGIDEMEKQRRSLQEPALRVAYFERAEMLFERLTELLLHQRRYAEALATSERKRGRSLLDAFPGNSTRATLASPSDLDALQVSLLPSTAILEFAFVGQRAVVWRVDRQSLLFGTSGATAAEIAQSVERERDAVHRDDDAGARREGRWLYDQLIAPAGAGLEKYDRVIVIPEGVLFSLPFASLVAADGRYLIETHSILVSPSASLSTSAGFRSSADPGLVVGVAEPAPRDLPALEQARSDTEELVRIYPRTAVYLGSSISPGDFLRVAAQASTLSFAGHATEAALLFEAPNDRPPLLLTASDIRASHFPLRPLVVLAACNTGSGRVRRTEGVDSLAAAFLGAGARDVLATLWDIDDESSSRLFTAFHRFREHGDLPVDALRNAQRLMLRSPTPRDRQPVSWAGVFVIGST